MQISAPPIANVSPELHEVIQRRYELAGTTWAQLRDIIPTIGTAAPDAPHGAAWESAVAAARLISKYEQATTSANIGLENRSSKISPDGGWLNVEDATARTYESSRRLIGVVNTQLEQCGGAHDHASFAMGLVAQLAGTVMDDLVDTRAHLGSLDPKVLSTNSGL